MTIQAAQNSGLQAHTNSGLQARGLSGGGDYFYAYRGAQVTTNKAALVVQQCSAFDKDATRCYHAYTIDPISPPETTYMGFGGKSSSQLYACDAIVPSVANPVVDQTRIHKLNQSDMSIAATHTGSYIHLSKNWIHSVAGDEDVLWAIEIRYEAEAVSPFRNSYFIYILEIDPSDFSLVQSSNQFNQLNFANIVASQPPLTHCRIAGDSNKLYALIPMVRDGSTIVNELRMYELSTSDLSPVRYEIMGTYAGGGGSTGDLTARGMAANATELYRYDDRIDPGADRDTWQTADVDLADFSTDSVLESYTAGHPSSLSSIQGVHLGFAIPD